MFQILRETHEYFYVTTFKNLAEMENFLVEYKFASWLKKSKRKDEKTYKRQKKKYKRSKSTTPLACSHGYTGQGPLNP